MRYSFSEDVGELLVSGNGIQSEEIIDSAVEILNRHPLLFLGSLTFQATPVGIRVVANGQAMLPGAVEILAGALNDLFRARLVDDDSCCFACERPDRIGSKCWVNRQGDSVLGVLRAWSRDGDGDPMGIVELQSGECDVCYLHHISFAA